jgi:CRISPR-associated protein Cas1
VAVLYVTEQRSVLRKTSDRIYIEKDHQVLLEVPCLKLDAVLLFGNVQVTTQALVELLDHGIELAFLSLSGKLHGQLTPPKARNLPLRMKQYESAHSAAFCLGLAREWVRGKIANAVAVLRRFRRNHPEALASEEIEAVEAPLSSALDRAASLDTLRGLEGAAAARYFHALRAMVPAAFGFDGRSRRPPRDPVNALLSFGYVLVGNELQSLLDGMGFDPYLGFYHQIDYGRPSLALDLLEEFRAPLVDRFCAGLLNRGVLRAEDFHPTAEGAVLLGREALQRYFPAYEEELGTPFTVGDEKLTFRQLFRRQAERLARTLTDGAPYESFRFPC